MQHSHFGHFLAISAVLLALALVLGCHLWSFQTGVSNLYGSVFKAGITNPALADLEAGAATPLSLRGDFIKEGTRWIHTTGGTVFTFAVILMVAAVVMLLANVGQSFLGL